MRASNMREIRVLDGPGTVCNMGACRFGPTHCRFQPNALQPHYTEDLKGIALGPHYPKERAEGH